MVHLHLKIETDPTSIQQKNRGDTNLSTDGQQTDKHGETNIPPKKFILHDGIHIYILNISSTFFEKE